MAVLMEDWGGFFVLSVRYLKLSRSEEFITYFDRLYIFCTTEEYFELN